MLNRKNIIFGLPVISFMWFSAAVIWGGYAYENYDHASQFISELGATGAEHGDIINYLGFIPAELCILVFVFLSSNILPKTVKNKIGLMLIALYAIMLGTAAIFPCDFGCRPEAPTLTHIIHISTAIPAYLSAILAIYLISSDAVIWSGSKTVKISGYILGSIALLAFFSMDESFQWVGIIQRTLEFSVYIWLIILGFYLKKVR